MVNALLMVEDKFELPYSQVNTNLRYFSLNYVTYYVGLCVAKNKELFYFITYYFTTLVARHSVTF